MSKRKSYFSSIDLYLAASFFIVMFVGNASIGGIPLNIFLPVLLIIFSSHFRANISQLVVVIFSAFIFLVYAIKVNVTYSVLYPLWIINFFLGYFYILIFNSRINKYPNSLLKVQFQICLVLLVVFSLGITSSTLGDNEQGRAVFIFGPNMLYRVIGFLSGICAGYLFYNNRLPEGLLVAVLSLALLTQTGSRGAMLLMPMLLLLWSHAYYKRFSLWKASAAAFVVIVSLGLIGTQIDFFAHRVLNFSTFLVDESSTYVDVYSRWKPYVYLLQEPDRFSLIGIEYQSWLDLFYSVGYFYPHSLLLELLMFYGVFGVVMCIYTIFKVMRIMGVLFSGVFTPAHLLYYSVITSGIGVLFSGDMGDNGAFLGMLIAMSSRVVQQQVNRRVIPPINNEVKSRIFSYTKRRRST